MDVATTPNLTETTTSTQSGELAPQKPGETTLTVDAVERAPRAETTKADRELDQMLNVVKKARGSIEHEVGITLDKETKEPIIRITEKDSGRVVREFPPEETRRLSEKLSQIRGLLIDKDA